MKIFETRNEMIKTFEPNLVIAELGVFKGDFSKTILELCSPKELVLIDIWTEGYIHSGDVDGNNLEYYNGVDLYNYVVKQFYDNPIVKIHKDYTTSVLENYSDDYFDVIYIDADHSYLGCKSDLEVSYRKVKNGGYIMGHDYEQNFSKCKNVYNFGVNQSVNEFCLNYDQEIEMKGNDGCVSYAIRIKK